MLTAVLWYLEPKVINETAYSHLSLHKSMMYKLKKESVWGFCSCCTAWIRACLPFPLHFWLVVEAVSKLALLLNYDLKIASSHFNVRSSMRF